MRKSLQRLVSWINKDMSPVAENRGGWFSLVHEPFAGAWQRNIEINHKLVPSFSAVFACISLIAGDVSKLWIKTQRLEKGVWLDSDKPSPKTLVLDQPNAYQNRNQFFENWMTSKLLRGNTYVLKRRDARGVVQRMHILDPNRITVLVSDSGDVFYELRQDNLSGLVPDAQTFPASEIIHDRFNCLFHPLVGLSPLYAAALPAWQGLNIQNNSAAFFGNRSMPGGIITAPSTIPDETAERIKKNWDQNFGGDKRGGTAVMGDGLEFKPITVTAEDAQLLEQAKATAEWVCSAFHVPPWKIGAAPIPAGGPEASNIQYYIDCVQRLLEDCETCLDRGLELGPTLGIQFDVEGLARMDTVSRINSLKEASSAGLISPNEGRAKLGYAPAKGGDSPMVQQQYFSLEALAERDKEKPFAKPAVPATPPPAQGQEPPDDPTKALLERIAALEARGWVGIWEDGKEYQPGQMVTHSGSVWHCNGPTMEKPGAHIDWTLAVKRGRDGKDAKPMQTVFVGGAGTGGGGGAGG
jgi:HK97 family phage portal protein